MFSNAKTLAWVVVLATSYAAAAAVAPETAPARRMLAREVGKPKLGGTFVGYRAMNPAEFQKTQDAGGKLIFEVQGDGGVQLGEGVYTTPGIRDWAEPGQVVCAIAVSTAPFQAFPKIVIPMERMVSTDEGLGGCGSDEENLWWDPANIEDYVNNINPAWNSDNTLRFAGIEGYEDQLQMLIGQELIQSHVFAVDCCPYTDGTCMNDLFAKYGNANYNDQSVWGAIHGGPVEPWEE